MKSKCVWISGTFNNVQHLFPISEIEEVVLDGEVNVPYNNEIMKAFKITIYLRSGRKRSILFSTFDSAFNNMELINETMSSKE